MTLEERTQKTLEITRRLVGLLENPEYGTMAWPAAVVSVLLELQPFMPAVTSTVRQRILKQLGETLADCRCGHISFETVEKLVREA